MPRVAAPPRLILENGTYYARWFDRGLSRTRRFSMGTGSPEEATARFAAWLTEHGGRPISGALHPNRRPTVESVLTFYDVHKLQPREKRKGASAVQRDRQCIARITSYFGSGPLADVTCERTERYAEARRAGKIGMPSGDGTIRRELAVLTAAANLALKRRQISRGDMPSIELPPVPEPRDFTLTKAQVDAVFKAARQVWTGAEWRDIDELERLPRIYRFVTACYFTASRPKAILELRWDQIDMERGLIRLNPRGRTQNKKKRPTVPIAKALMTVIQRADRERKTPYFLDITGDIDRSHDTLRERVGIPGLTPYVWRHTRATHLVEADVPLEKVAALLGDKLATVEKNYVHLNPDFLLETVDV